MARNVEVIRNITVLSDFAKDEAAENGEQVVNFTLRAPRGIDASPTRMAQFVASLRKLGLSDVITIEERDDSPAGANTKGGATEASAARAWAKANGVEVSDRGRVAETVVQQYREHLAKTESAPAE